MKRSREFIWTGQEEGAFNNKVMSEQMYVRGEHLQLRNVTTERENIKFLFLLL